MKNISIIFAFFCGILLSCNTQSKEEAQSPNQVFNLFVDAIAKNNIATAKQYATAESNLALTLMLGSINKSKKSNTSFFDKSKYEFGNAIIKQDEAKIPINEKGSKVVIDIPMKKELGKWKVAFDAKSLGNIIMGTLDLNSLLNDNNSDSMMNKLKTMNIDSATKFLDKMKKDLESISPE
jgi:hypothetical protein